MSRQRRLPDPRNPVAPFAGASWFRPGKVVTAGARMGIDDPKRCRLEPQMRKHAAEHGVLVHIGEIARMKGVAVIHGAMMNKSRNGAILNSLMRPTGE